ncbi:MAG: hypothetical protein Q8O67_17625 [Deltaproteobacteria bacterium]|nr:hypothetical protein [Deltaproteobacteria bacterium]
MGLEDEKQKLALKAGKDFAQRALENLTMTEEEKAARAEEDAQKRKILLVKIILGATAVVAGGITLVSLFAAMWPYLVALIVMAGIGGAGYLVAKPKLKAWNEARTAGDRLEAAEREKLEAVKAVEQQKLLVEKQKVAAAKKLEDDLARLKKQI